MLPALLRAGTSSLLLPPGALTWEGGVACSGRRCAAYDGVELIQRQVSVHSALIDEPVGILRDRVGGVTDQVDVAAPPWQDLMLATPSNATEPPPSLQDLIFAAPGNATELPSSLQVAANSDADLGILMSALASNSLIFVGAAAVFCILRRRFPLVYSHRLLTEDAAVHPGDSYLGWVPCCARLTVDEACRASGLDQAMLLEFCSLSMRVLLYIGAPQVLVLCPLHMWFGGQAAGNDKLSFLGFGNVQHGSWVCWAHAVNVWYVVLVTMSLVYDAQKKFLPRRYAWLRSLRAPRSTSVLVEGIPPEYRSDAALQEYFVAIFSKEQVLSAYVARRTPDLIGVVRELESAEHALRKAEFKWERSGWSPEGRPKFLGLAGAFEDEIEYYQREISSLQEKAAQERGRINGATGQECEELYASSGFVTFRTGRDAVLALQVQYREDKEVFAASIPPDPVDVIWEDLQVDPVRQKTYTAIGTLAVLGLFCGFLPLVIALSAVTDLHNLQARIGLVRWICEEFPVLASVLDGVLGSLALNLLMDLLPTTLMLIFHGFYQLKSEAWAQHRLQVCYFWFQLIFVVLITAVGNSLIAALKEVIEQPLQVFSLLATSLPQATHFYMNFVVLQWATHAMALTRQMPLLKFLFFRTLYGEAEAKEMAEPEDQDAYGIGSRSARFSIHMVTALVFCSLSPLITILAAINFFLCRLAYSYLLVFAETKKPDLGGAFWVTQLEHVQYGVLVYILLMLGVLLHRAGTWGPCALASPVLAVWLYMRLRFSSSMRWTDLPFEEVVFSASDPDGAKNSLHERYHQLELCEPQSEPQGAVSPLRGRRARKAALLPSPGCVPCSAGARKPRA